MKKSVWTFVVVAVVIGITMIVKKSDSDVIISDIELLPVAVSDTSSHSAMHDLVEPYRKAMRATMDVVIGRSDITMEVYRPESPLSNLVADMMLYVARQTSDVDIAIANVGGIRTTLRAGNITVGNVYEILPFDNSLVIMTYKGSDIQDIADAMAVRGGEAVAGMRFTITEDGKAQNITVGNKPLDAGNTYTVVSIDYLSNGNDGLQPMVRYLSLQPLGIMMRDAMILYIKSVTDRNKSVFAATDGRVKVI